MGYNSKIRICTTKEGFKKVKSFVDDKTKCTNTRNLISCLDEEIVGKDRDFVIFGWDWIKWDQYIYDDAKAVIEALDILEDMNIPYNFIRVGESSEGDIENQNNDPYNTLPWISVDTVINYDESILEPKGHFALFSCDDWKSHSSMSLVGVFTKDELINQLNKEIEVGDMEFGRDNSLELLSIRDIESSLKYGFIQELSINEVL